MKTCSKCSVPKRANQFYLRNRKTGLRRRECIECVKRKVSDWASKNPQLVKNRQNRWNREHPERKKTHSRTSRLSLKGLTQVSYDTLLHLQGGHCALCDATEDLCIDHDHKCCPGKRSCGKCVRGILCRKHNSGIGHFDDDTVALKLAIEYLRRSNDAPTS